MAPRLVELRRVLKPAGSIYLHCDPTASHYLKLLMDAVFGVRNYRNEISWKRTNAHNDPKRFGRIHDVLLFYSKDAQQVKFNPVYLPYSRSYLSAEFRQDENGRWYKCEDLTAPWHGGEGGRFQFHGRRPGANRMWRLSKEAMESLWQQGRIKCGDDGKPLLRGHIVYLDEKRGMPAQDWWDDLLRVGNTSSERLGYPTQKPEALLERIIRASSNEGDIVLDPFCGCGTAIAAAQKLRRQWIGIDITHLAINLIKHRLLHAHGLEAGKDYQVIGEPVDVSAARQLAQEDPFQFQSWALGLVGARVTEQKKGSDKGIDGRLYFHDEPKGKTKQIIFSVKAGQNISVAHVRDLRGVIEREKAEIGVLITMEEPTQPMKSEAAAGGFYTAPFTQSKHPRIQLRTIRELLDGKGVDYPARAGANVTYKKAPRHEREQGVQQQLPVTYEDEE